MSSVPPLPPLCVRERKDLNDDEERLVVFIGSIMKLGEVPFVMQALDKANVEEKEAEEREEGEQEEEDEAAAEEEKAKFVNLGCSWLFFNAPTSLLWRECYNLFISHLVHRLSLSGRVLLSGSSGVGKSQLQAVLLAILCLAGKPVVVDLAEGCFARVHRKPAEGKAIVEFGIRKKDFRRELKLPTTIYLFDTRPNVSPLEVHASTVVTASPALMDRINKSQWKKDGPNPTQLFLPPWSLQELLALRRAEQFQHIPRDLVVGLYGLYGGNVRRCIFAHQQKPTEVLSAHAPIASSDSVDETPKTEEEDLKASVRRCDTNVLVKYIQSMGAVSKNLELDEISHVHSLLLMFPSSANFRDFQYSFASRFVRDTVLSSSLHTVDTLDKFKTALAHRDTPPALTAIKGQVFEAHCHRVFQKAFTGKQPITRLFEDREEECEFDFPDVLDEEPYKFRR